MLNCFKSAMIAAGAALVLSSAALAQTGQKSKTAAPRAARSFDPHDLSGVWDHATTPLSGIQAYRGASADDPVPPFTPWGQEKFNAAKPGFGPRTVSPTMENDPILKCDPQGFPRAFTQENPEPMEIIQIPGRILQFVEWNHVWRTIWTDGRELPKDVDPTWYGYSVGKWEGDTFVVDTIGLDERTWLDPFGDPHSIALRVQERYRRVAHDTMEFTMTIDDPKTYTKPWVMVNKRLLKLNPKYELQEAICAPSDEQLFNNAVTNPAANGATRK
jgi:hypothetical protein